jgi:zinc D-Ala-D-Ala carboxypeptidase
MNAALLIGLGLIYIATRATRVNSETHASPHFTWKELTTTSTGLPNDPGTQEEAWLEALSVEILEPLRRQFGPIKINSGYRSEAVNLRVNGSPTSQHMKGQAADIVSPNYTPEQIATWIYLYGNIPVRQVIIYPPNNGNFLHVSIDPNRPPKRQFLIKNQSLFESWKPV